MEKLKIKNKFKTFKVEEGFLPESLSELEDYLRKFVIWIESMYSDLTLRVNRNMGLTGEETWNPGNVADGEMVSEDVTVTGADLGDFAMASFSLDVADLVLDANVTATNTVTVTLTNDGINAGVNLASGTLRVRVIKQ
ncbi:MAG: hypothetical protein ACYS9Y_13810 [Planctomycetota bacterium]|jgi:hypothetical protein